MNGTRWRLLTSRADWARHLPGVEGSGSVDVEWHERSKSLALRQEGFRFPMSPDASVLTMQDRRGIDADRYANRYWIDEPTTGIRVRATHWDASAKLWPVDATSQHLAGATFGPEPVGEPARDLLRGLAVTTDHFLVVGVLEPTPGLLIFDLHGGGPPVRRHWSHSLDDRPFRPWDIAARPGGGVWILDLASDGDAPHEASGTPRLWTLDRRLQIEGEAYVPGRDSTFQPLGDDQVHPPKPARVSAGAIDLDEGGGRSPIGLAGAPDDSLFLVWTSLGERDAMVSRRVGGVLDSVASVPSPTKATFDTEPWRPHAFVFRDEPVGVAGETRGRLYVVGQDGNQSYEFTVAAARSSLELGVELEYLPMRRFTGKGLAGLPFGVSHEWPTGVLYDTGDRWIKLVPHPRPRYATTGTLEMTTDGALDSGQHGCVWHRVIMDAQVPPGTSIGVETRAADRLEDLDDRPWTAEPAPYLKRTGSEIPYARPVGGACPGPTKSGAWETLCQSAIGRFMQLRVRLRGTGRTTPRVFALRVHQPRFSYLERYLPGIYREDVTSASFLERFLANVEGISTELEGLVAEVQSLFDERIVDPAYLEWLAAWIGVTLDPSWTDAKRRLFLSNAPKMFRERGTLRGLARAIRLSIDPCADASLFDDKAQAPGIGGAADCSASCPPDPFGVRLIEGWVTRSAPGVVFGDPDQAISPRYTIDAWTPADGADELHRRWRDYLAGVYSDDAALGSAWQDSSASLFHARFSPVVPANEMEAADWRTFTSQAIGFTYAVPAKSDAAHWRSFLAQRYRTVDAINLAHQTSYTSFRQVALPATLPDGTALIDWVQFASLALPVRRAAHRFVVLVPSEGRSETAERARLDLVRRVVEIERPAHAAAEVRPYWAAFRVGGARVGLDTLVDRGSRFSAITLGATGVGSGFAMHAHPFDITDRYVVGREQVIGGGEA